MYIKGPGTKYIVMITFIIIDIGYAVVAAITQICIKLN